MSSVRAFLAVPLPKELRASIAVLQKALSEQIAEVRWSSPENLHLTLRFFGETEQETLERVRVSMLSVKTCLSPFEVMVKGLGAFPDLTRTVAAFEHALIGRFQVKQLVLYASQLHAGGVEHRPLAQVDLN